VPITYHPEGTPLPENSPLRGTRVVLGMRRPPPAVQAAAEKGDRDAVARSGEVDGVEKAQDLSPGATSQS
jgi:hypothetical protein